MTGPSSSGARCRGRYWSGPPAMAISTSGTCSTRSCCACSVTCPGSGSWTPAAGTATSAGCSPGGLFVFTVNHLCFEQLWPVWREHGEYRTRRYLAPYEIPAPSGTDFYRTLSAYLNQLIGLGCQVTELAEPGLAPEDTAG